MRLERMQNRYQQMTSRPQHPRELRDTGPKILNVRQSKAAHDDVELLSRKRQGPHVALPEFGTWDVGRGALEHLRGEIDPEDVVAKRN
jgi:hypothetical protein